MEFRVLTLKVLIFQFSVEITLLKIIDFAALKANFILCKSAKQEKVRLLEIANSLIVTYKNYCRLGAWFSYLVHESM